MNIVVCIKQVPSTDMQIEFDFDKGTLCPEDLVYIVNPYDMLAVEEALQIKEKIGGTVTLISFGPPRVERALRKCLAMGADEAIHLCDNGFENVDLWTTSFVLSKAISELDFDIILCGKKAIDDNAGQVGIYLAELLNIPQVTGVTKLEISSNKSKVKVHKALARGDREVIECPLPAVFTVELELNQPRYPSFPHSLAALRKEIKVLSHDSLGLELPNVRNSTTQLIEIAPPKPRTKKIFTPDSKLPASERLKFIMSGGLTKKTDSQIFYEDSIEDAASQVANLLINKEIISI